VPCRFLRRHLQRIATQDGSLRTEVSGSISDFDANAPRGGALPLSDGSTGMSRTRGLVQMVRPADEADAVAIAAIYAPYVRETAISFEIEPPSVATMARRIASTVETHPWLVSDCGGEVVGFHPLGSIGGYYSRQYIAKSDTTINVPAHGYMYLQNGFKNPGSMLDFNREKELPAYI